MAWDSEMPDALKDEVEQYYYDERNPHQPQKDRGHVNLLWFDLDWNTKPNDWFPLMGVSFMLAEQSAFARSA
jgi:hypothetical protein